MRTYLDLLQHILDNGGDKGDRTGTGTRSVFGHQMRFDLSKGFPLLTTKKVHFRSIVIELLWFLKGDTNVQYLQDNKVTFGMNGQLRNKPPALVVQRVSLGQFMATSGATLAPHKMKMAATSKMVLTKSNGWLMKSKLIPIHAV